MAGRDVLYTVEDIMDILPHRFPFVLLDRAVSLTEGPNPPNRSGRKVVAIKNVTYNEPYFVGHFPHRPVMPGVLQIEAMAQASALAAYREEYEGNNPQDVAIVSVSDAKFRRPVVPGDTLEIHAEIVKDRGSMLMIKAYTMVDGSKVSECELMAKVFPIEKRKKG
jgi:beta-hydroxyacyl-ACP dehydratase FabZ